MNQRRLFVASCIALITSAFTFSIRGDILQALGHDFTLSQESLGWIGGAAFLGMAVAMFIGAPLCDVLGMGTILALALTCHLIGVFGTIFAPHGKAAFWVLYASTFLAGAGNGLVEIGINPLAATLFPTRKTHYLNILHAWWPGGLIIGGLLALFLGNGIDFGFVKVPGLGLGWQAKMVLIVVPAVTYGTLMFAQRFPVTERVASGVSTGEMFGEVLRPMFLIFAFCMLLTASTELGPQQWQNSVITRTTDEKVSGTLILVYTSGMMFILRHFAGPLADRISPVGMLTGSAVLSAIGLYLLSYADSAATAFGFATIYGLGIAYFWPTMLGVTAERFPKGGALLLGLMGCVGNLAIAAVLPQMGRIVDRYTVEKLAPAVAQQVVVDGKPDPDKTKALTGDAKKNFVDAEKVGFAMAFRWVSVLPVVLIFIFGGIVLYDRARGGYKAVHLTTRFNQSAPGPEGAGP